MTLISRRMVLLSPFTRRPRKSNMISISNVSDGPINLSKNTAVQMEVINPRFRAIIELSNDNDRIITKKQRIEWFDTVTGNGMSEVEIRGYMRGGDES